MNVDCTDNNESMSVTANICYDEMTPRWNKITDTIQDEYQVKSKGVTYLPMPSGIAAEKNETTRSAMYNAYKSRAVYFSYLSSTIGAMMGLLTRKPTQFVLPDRIMDIINKASFDGDSLSVIVNRTLENQLSYSRYGILLDIPEGATGTDVIPFMAEYKADKIVNWAQDIINGKKTLTALILDESYYDYSAGLNYTWVEKYRICALDYKGKDIPVYYTYETDVAGVNDFTNGQPMPENSIIPTIMKKNMSIIPFQPFNALSLEMGVEIPVLMQLVDISLAIYRGEADYRQSLFMQGQATPYVFGANLGDNSSDSVLMGATTMIQVGDKDAKAGFVEVSGNGLGAQEKALNDLHIRASEQGVMLTTGGNSESGEALNVRVGIKTASLAGIAKVNAQGFQNLLRWSGEWVGLSENDISEIQVIPNTDFSDNAVSMDELVKLSQAVEKGLFRMEDFYEWLIKNELTNAPDFATWKDELQASGLGVPDFVQNNSNVA